MTAMKNKIWKGLFIVFFLGVGLFSYVTNSLLYESRLDPEEKNLMLMHSVLKEIAEDYATTGGIRENVLDEFGTPFAVKIEGRTIVIKSAGKDRIFNTDDDLVGRE